MTISKRLNYSYSHIQMNENGIFVRNIHIYNSAQNGNLYNAHIMDKYLLKFDNLVRLVSDLKYSSKDFVRFFCINCQIYTL